MPSWTKSIRVRLTFWYTLLVLSTLLLFGGISYYVVSSTLSEKLDMSLRKEVRWVRDFIEPQASKLRPGKRTVDVRIRAKAKPAPPPTAAPPVDSVSSEIDEIWNQVYRHTLQSSAKTYIQFNDRSGTIIYRSDNLAADSLVVQDTLALYATIVTTTHIASEVVRVAVFRDQNFTYLVGYPLSDLRDLLESLYWIFLVLLPIALTISVVGGFMLAKKSLRPVEDITTRARRITAENLDQTIPARSVDDELGRLTGTINDMIGRLHASFAQVKQFSADASHELRTPLTIVRGEIELALRNPKTPDDYRRVLESTLEEVMRMNAIVENLLVLAKADQGSFRAEFAEVDLGELVDELYEDTEVLAGRKHIHLELKKKALITLVGDRIRLRQLFLNLIDNAIKYTPEGGSVSLTVDRQDGMALFRVEDTGMGIPQEEIGKIFDRFYRVDKARSREMGGSGLGLSIARWIAEMHRGTITVTSELHKGSSFTVSLPIS
jgi:two-component system OmpR family sensor kinase